LICLKNIYGENERELVNIDLRNLAQKLATVVATLGEKPYIRFIPGDKNSECVAKALEERLSSLEYKEEVKDRGTVFIFDRTVDLVAPVLHEFTYQAMVYDLLEVTKDVYKYVYQNNANQEAEKSVLLGEIDQLWPVLRHRHIADTITYVIDSFNEFVRTNKAVQLQTKKKEVTSLKEMGDAMKAMPQFQELLNKYSLHIHMAGQCMKVFKHKQLDVLGLLEQEMATNEDEKGSKSKNVVSRLTPYLSDAQVSQEEKLRLLMIYIASQEGVSEADRKALADKASLSSDDRKVLDNLSKLFTGKEKTKKEKKKKDKKEKKNEAYELSRYAPKIKDLMDGFAEGELPPEFFGFVGKNPAEAKENKGKEKEKGVSLKSKTGPTWAENRKSEKVEITGPRVIIFIIGGITYSEVRASYELTNQYSREFILGSTHLTTPANFIECIKKL